jgi:hypothetical protein
MPNDDTPVDAKANLGTVSDAGAPPRRELRLPGGRSTHGLGSVGTLTRAARRARLSAFDKRTAAGRLLYEARQGFVAHLGGEDELSATEAALIERLAMRQLVLSLVDDMVLKAQATGTPRDVLEVARQQAALDQGYVAMLREVGWRPKAKDANLVDEIAALHRQREAGQREAGTT